jgi:hypothetical protein
MTNEASLEILELEQELKDTRRRMYKIAFWTGLLGALPVLAIKDSAPWVIAIPICVGALLGIIFDVRKARTKATVLHLAKNISAVGYSAQSFRRVPGKPPISTANSPSIDVLLDRERFGAQARETKTSSQHSLAVHA